MKCLSILHMNCLSILHMNCLSISMNDLAGQTHKYQFHMHCLSMNDLANQSTILINCNQM